MKAGGSLYDPLPHSPLAWGMAVQSLPKAMHPWLAAIRFGLWSPLPAKCLPWKKIGGPANGPKNIDSGPAMDMIPAPREEGPLPRALHGRFLL